MRRLSYRQRVLVMLITKHVDAKNSSEALAEHRESAAPEVEQARRLFVTKSGIQ